MQKRLFLSTAILITVVVLTLAGLSQWVVGDLVTRRQAEYEQDSFRQAGQRVQSIFLAAEGTMEYMNRDPRIRTVLTEPFDRNNALLTLQFTNIIETALHATKINRSSLDSVIFLGSNGFSCLYTQKDILFDSRLLESFSSLSQVIEGSALGHRLDSTTSPQFIGDDGGETSANIAEAELSRLVSHKILLSRRLYSSAGRLDGVIIVLVRNDLLSAIIPESPYERTLFLCMGTGDMVWSNRPTDDSTVSFLKAVVPGRLPWSGRLSSVTGDNLVTASVLDPTDLLLVSRTSVRTYFKQVLFLSLVTLGFALASLAIAFVSSWFFSRRSTQTLKELAQHLAQEGQTLPEKMNLLPETSWSQNTSLRVRLYLHFTISLIIPLLLFGTLLAILDFQVYKEKIVELAQSYQRQILWTLEDDLRSWDRASSQLIFEDDVQSLLAGQQASSQSPGARDRVMTKFLSTLIGKKSLLSFHLFDARGYPVLSSLSETPPTVSELIPNFFSNIQDSSGALVSYGIERNFSGQGASLVFARKVLDKNIQFGSLLGYLVFTVDPEVALSRASGMGISESIKVELMAKPPVDKGSYDVNEGIAEEGPALIFTDSIASTCLQLVGTVPIEGLTAKVWPLLVGELSVLFLATLFCALTSVVISGRLSRPLRILEGLMEDIRREKFDVRMNYTGRDEITVLAHSFNRMVDRLNELVHENYRVKVEQSELRLLEREAQLSALQQQINPHFLYNTLDSIQWMAYAAGAMEISRMATALGKFFRAVVHTGYGMVTIAEELEMLENYLDIQRIRYQEKLKVHIDIDPALRHVMTLKLLLQPLVENSITHGIEPKKEGGTIWIQVSRESDFVRFKIRDNGVGMSEKQLKGVGQRHSIGLDNVSQRLNLHYGESGKLTIESETNIGTCVTINHPILEPIGRLSAKT